MKIFIDSANLEEIKEVSELGFLDGVTTNPSLIKKAVEDLKNKGEKIDIKNYIKAIILAVPNGIVSLEVTSFSFEEMIKQGRKLFKTFNSLAGNIYIKIPINPTFGDKKGIDFDGLKAIKKLSEEKIPVNCTLIFSPEQALLAAKAGAKIVSPFVGRLDDYLREMNNFSFEKSDYYPAQGKNGWEDKGIVSGVDLVKKIVDIFKKYNLKTEVLAASIRNSRQLREVALVGADIATLPFKVIKDLLFHYKTKEGMLNFIKDSIPEYIDLIEGKLIK